jgi:hypothetical protein
MTSSSTATFSMLKEASASEKRNLGLGLER